MSATIHALHGPMIIESDDPLTIPSPPVPFNLLAAPNLALGLAKTGKPSRLAGLIRLSRVLLLSVAIALSECSTIVSASTMDLAGTSDATLTRRTALAVNVPESTVQIVNRAQDGSWIYYDAHAGHRAYRCKVYKPSTQLSVTQGPPNRALAGR